MRERLFSVLLLAGSIGLAQAEEARLMRFPTTNGSDVVFSYAGDLYKAPIEGGDATRLTSHVGYEMFAHFSPDGQTIAFTGQYDGNTEVYKLPISGGQPIRLTYTATNERDDLGDRMGPNNVVLAWSPDGKNIVYRNRISSGFDGMLWKIGEKGGMSQQIKLPEGGFCCYSPDGQKLAFNRVFREFRTWKHYKGGMADDIWIYDESAKSVINVTNNAAQDIIPMWIGDEIFYISDRDRVMNLFVYNTKTKKTEKVTDFTDYDIKFPSTNGKLIVFEKGGYLFRFDPVTRQSAQIHVNLNAEGVYARAERRNVGNGINSISMPLNAKRLALTARGEVFDVPVAKGVTKNITRTPGSNDRSGAYSPDGKFIAYIGDKTGETEVWLYNVEERTTTQISNDNDTYIRQLMWAPNSKTLLYTDRKNRIVTIDVASGVKTIVQTNEDDEFRDVSFSPDSRWITYTKPSKNDMNVVYVYQLTSKKEIAITEKWYDSFNPIFSEDGKYLIYTSQRDLNPTYSNTEWNHAYTKMGGLYMTLLSKDTKSPFLPTDGEETSVPTPMAKPAAKNKTASTEPNLVQVDEEDIINRMIKLPLAAGDYIAVYSNGKKVWFSGRSNSQVFDLETQKTEQVAEGMMGVSGEKAMLYVHNNLYVTDIPNGKATLDDPVYVGDMVADIDYNQEWAQIFDEAWRAYRDGFYLESMHGIDWKAMKEKYAVLLPYVKCRLDLNYVIGEMIGELTCGHSYVTPGDYTKAARTDMGLLGAEMSRTDSGFYRIDRIMKGATYSKSLRSPLTEPGMDVKEGDYIIAIDGVSVTTTTNIYSLLVGKSGILTELLVNSKPSATGAHKIVVSPISDEYPLLHYEWVQKNIAYVDKATNGRVGYVYIPDMGVDGLNEFTRYFYPQLDKEALIIDDRANGGGNVSPMILERLAREPYRLTMSRGSKRTHTVPDATLCGPKVCLINKYSASDGDLFPWGFRALGLGKLVGTRTWGGIVGISGSLPFMDGTDIRVPFFTSYDPKTGEWIIENHGVDPDYLIDNDPLKEAAGEDQQLDKAIEVILKDLESRQPLPGVPAPRDFSK